MTTMRYQQALAAAVRDEMASDPHTIYIGEDVEQSLRFVSVGLAEEHPGRVRDMPISEAAFTGFATGAAMAGQRPIVEYQIPTLLYVAFDQIVNQAHKIRLMTGGQTQVPVTYLFPGSGARLGLAGQHSDHPYSLLAHAGIKTVIPSSPQDAYSLMRAAIQDNDPVAVFAPAACLHRKGEVNLGEVGQIGQGSRVRAGEDVTVVTLGHLVWEVLAALDSEEPEVSADVLDARSVYPFDWTLLAESIKRTGRLVVVDDANRTCGFAAEVAATAAQTYFHYLRSPIIRVTRADGVVPFALPLEQAVLPSRAQIIAAVRQVMQ
jgi:pyruvate/2-oxoglutarate/acetoin dehydrogenase E1 component